MGLLSHVLHPEVGVELNLETVQLAKGEKLRGLCLVSPPLSFDITGESYTTNSSTDFVSSNTVHEMVTNLFPPSIAFVDGIQNPQLSPGSAPAEHWLDIPVSNVLITVGEKEVLYTSCLEFAEKLKQSCDSTKLVVGKGKWHDSAIVDLMFGIQQVEGWSGQAIAKWMSEMGSLHI